jgi:hypothetical protein
MLVATCLAFIQLTSVLQRSFREIKLWLKLEHENIVPLWGVADGFGSLPALVSPWLENGALTGYLQRNHEVLSYNQKFALVRSISHIIIISTLKSVQLKDIARGLQYRMFDVLSSMRESTNTDWGSAFAVDYPW